ncbi:hypothetical protein J2847_002958 [Azospirillum agricola]|uniref:hypothetical protein n=1 Tax=Azospirillum agricola TaxID=1720247 RepID=UPI001AE0FEC6|nr:hypothetical protein [Azospirillum agricola]MBP2229659.1 hypothetical protein [Azospirillum agricola]
MHKILKSFRYSEDGVTSRLLEKDAVVDIRADLVAGLEGEGFIGPPDKEAAKTGGRPAAKPAAES